jgi:hypothetical protein
MNGSRRTRFRRAALGSLCLALACVVSPASADDLTDEVVKQARARQEKVKSFVVKVKRTEVLEPGSMAKGNKVFAPRPKERTTITSEARLVVQGSSFRFEGSWPVSRADGTLIRQDEVVGSDGAVEKFLYPKDLGDGLGIGVIGQGDRGAAAKMKSVAWPLLMALRGLDPALAADELSRLTPSDVTLPLLGIPCRRFDLQRSGGYVQTFWIDESGLIRRKANENNGQLLSQTNVRYERRYGFDAFPVSWTSVLLSRAGAAQCERTLEVVEATINQPVPDEELEIRFPPECVVHDEIARKEYVVQADGSMVEKPPSKGQPHQPGLNPSRYRGPIAVCLVAVLAVVVAGCLTRLRWRKQEANPPSNSA